MRQNVADFLYSNFLGRTSKKKHPVEIRSDKSVILRFLGVIFYLAALLSL